ncbi:MAG: ABC transporter permease [Chloroflexi bacterium]|nr:ABC transporter permease [Chloroflexota bacterium]
MGRFLLRRFIFAIVSIIGATIFVFSMSRLAGDPILLYAKPGGYGMSDQRIADLRAKLGLDKPLIVQYFLYMGRTLRGDLGNTLLAERPVRTVISEKMGATIQLSLAGWLLATLVGVPIGVLSAVRRGGFWDYIGRGLALFGQATPAFWVGILAILIFAVKLGWLPVGTRGPTDGFPLAWSHIKYFILPAVTVGIGSMAGYARLTRSAMLEVLDSEFVKLARTKGVANMTVIWKHAFRNALIPPLTVSALLFANLLNGSVIAESVFAWPGVGKVVLLDAVYNNDYPLLTGGVLFFTLIFLFFSLFADILYGIIDPRIRYS